MARGEHSAAEERRGETGSSYTFFFPHVPPSGVSSLFARLAQAITGAKAGRVRLIDFPGGAMARSLASESKVEVVEFSQDASIAIGPEDTLVMQAELPDRFRRQLRVHPHARIIQWQLHPHNLMPPLLPLIGHRDFWLRRPGLYRAGLAFGLPRQRRNAMEFVKLCVRKRSLFFQDSPGLQATETFLGLTVPSPILLPVPVSVPPSPVRTGRIAAGELHVAWVGRLYDFKIHILVHTIRRFIARTQTGGHGVTLHVVGDGPKQAMLDQFGEGADGLTLIRYGDLTAQDLRKLLVERVDLVASMGTAALEGAALGLPVILLDFAFAEVPRSYQFKWLFQAKGFELGHAITAADCCTMEDSFSAILTELEKDYVGAARRCFAYVKEHHSMESVTNQFLELSRAAALRFGDVPAHLWRKSWMRRLYERVRY